MSRSKQRGHSEIEHLRGIIRSLKSEIRHLRKRLKQIEHKEEFYQEVLEELPVENVNIHVCRKCNVGILTETDFKFVIIKKCSNCDYEERKKKV